jgi:hypothetical protein
MYAKRLIGNLTLSISGGAKRRPLHAVVRPPSNTNAIDIHLLAYRFFPPTPGTAAI